MINATNLVEVALPKDVPPGWRRTTLGEIGEYINGRGFKKSEWSDKGLPIIRIQNLTGTGKEQNYYDGNIDERHVVNPGDLLISWAATLGAYLWTGPRAALNQHIFKVRSFVDKKFHFYLMQHILGDLYRQTHGSGMVHVTKSKFDSMPVLVPATEDQQKVVVAEIEKQFSRLDEAVATLKRVKANLKRYKAAVLKAAVEGRLVETEAERARREGRGYETGAQLLQRILETRSTQWQGKGKYKEPAAPDTTDMVAELPDGWTWASVDQVTSDSLIGLDRGRDQQNSEGIGVPYVKMNNVTVEGDVSSDGMVYVVASDDERRRFNLQTDDLLFNTRNSKELVGKVGIVRVFPKGAIYNNNLMRLRLNNGAIPSFVCSQMCSDGFRRRMELVKKATTNVAAVYAKDLFPLPLALPPETEQQRIVAEIDLRLTLIRKTEAQVDANLQRAERLRKSLLSKIFVPSPCTST